MKKLRILTMCVGIVWGILSTLLAAIFTVLILVMSLVTWNNLFQPDLMWSFFWIAVIGGALGTAAMIIYDRKGFMEIVNDAD